MGHTELRTAPKGEKLSNLVTVDEKEKSNSKSLPRVNPLQVMVRLMFKSP